MSDTHRLSRPHAWFNPLNQSTQLTLISFVTLLFHTIAIRSLFVFGGSTGGKFLNDFWIYSSETATWCKKPCVGAVPSPRGYHTTNVLHTGRRGDTKHRLLIFGGWDGR